VSVTIELPADVIDAVRRGLQDDAYAAEQIEDAVRAACEALPRPVERSSPPPWGAEICVPGDDGVELLGWYVGVDPTDHGMFIVSLPPPGAPQFCVFDGMVPYTWRPAS
jgi:hypothetical protein